MFHVIANVLAVIGAVAVVFGVFAVVAFIIQISKNGWNN